MTITKESKEYPAFSAILNASKGVSDDAMRVIIPEENEDTREKWQKVTEMIEKHVPDIDAQNEIDSAISDYELSMIWLAYKNGIRIALQLQEEMKKIVSASPAY